MKSTAELSWAEPCWAEEKCSQPCWSWAEQSRDQLNRAIGGQGWVKAKEHRPASVRISNLGSRHCQTAIRSSFNSERTYCTCVIYSCLFSGNNDPQFICMTADSRPGFIVLMQQIIYLSMNIITWSLCASISQCPFMTLWSFDWSGLHIKDI